jgi:hypothetical protein
MDRNICKCIHMCVCVCMCLCGWICIVIYGKYIWIRICMIDDWTSNNIHDEQMYVWNAHICESNSIYDLLSESVMNMATETANTLKSDRDISTSVFGHLFLENQEPTSNLYVAVT